MTPPFGLSVTRHEYWSGLAIHLSCQAMCSAMALSTSGAAATAPTLSRFGDGWRLSTGFSETVAST